MNLTSPSQVKAWCIEHDFHPNRTMGQNFLIDHNALVAIVDAGLEKSAAEGGKAPRVLEIGPGLGVLTEELLARGAEVVAVEKDPVLAARLKESLGNPERLTVVAGDALEWIAKEESAAEKFDCMVSNLPYQAGTRILLELVLARRLPVMTVLVQTEVAERLAAKEGSKTRGLAGVWAQLDYDVEIVRKVAASCFWPRPEIGSTVVRLVQNNRNCTFTPEERDLFRRLTKTAFSHRRKQLGSIFKNMVQSTARAEELSNDDWINLVKGLLKNEDT
jgi:16S rRNA (adenine1518-N6/adenine1519-N6)-dimethyltransferase